MELISKDNKVLKEVLTSMKEYSSNDEMAIYYDTELQAEMIRNSEIEEATNNGLKLGEERGALNKQQEIAKNLLQVKPEIPLEVIIKTTGLSLEELEELKSS